MWWVFGLGVLVAALIKTFKWDKRIRKRLQGSAHGAIALATGVGLVSPLCSCGIVPLVISLIYGGVPLAPVFALLITSPLMSPDAFVITLGGLGPTPGLGQARERGLRRARAAATRCSRRSGSAGSAARGCSGASGPTSARSASTTPRPTTRAAASRCPSAGSGTSA